MEKNYLKKFGLYGAMFATALGAQAIEEPTLALETLTAGQSYVLVSPMNPTGYMSRTGWDGALYFLGPNDSNFANHALEAVDNGDGSWAFVTKTPSTTAEGADTTLVKYMYLPEGGANINMGDSAVWFVEPGSVEGHYWLKAGAGNNTAAQGLYMHLNPSWQYFVISYNGGPFYPDYAIKTDSLGNQLLDEVTGNWQMADSTQLNWGFVTVENMKKYADMSVSYEAILNYDIDYCGMGGDYVAGFELGCTAAEAIYNNPDFEGSYAEAITAILNAKVNLFVEIEKAIALNVDANEALANAIADALNVFNTTAVAADVNAAVEALVAAQNAYSQGLGDYTSMGQNMSFEDLTAQGGSQTSGVANPPLGWNLYINNNICLTAQDIRNAGVTAWCGVNNDCEGDIKDGEVGFGIWNQGLPKVELSQTITGIENGTYEISAGLMVGANGNGSRRTTQRIFGNLNSTYFASEDEYNKSLLDNSEIYTFANLVEPVTDRLLQHITVLAYVYDGTLTFGFRTDNNIKAANRESSNSAGGDGWFKIDNFRITKVGYDPYTALAVLQYYVDMLDSYYMENEAIYGGIVEKMETTLEQFEDLDNTTPEAELNAGIQTALALMEEVKPYITAYETLSAAIADAYAALAEYGTMPGAPIFESVITAVEADYYAGVYDIQGVEAAIARLEAALEDCKKSEVKPGMDLTHLLANPSFEDMTAQPSGDSGGVENAPKGWNLVINGDTCVTAADVRAAGITAWCAINSGDAIAVEVAPGDTVFRQPVDGNKVWGIWNDNIPSVELSQKITGLPMGTYTLTANVMVQNNWAGNNITTQRIFGNNFVQMFSSDGTHELNLPEDAIAARETDAAYPEEEYDHLTYAGYSCPADDRTTDLLRPMSVTFCVYEDGVAHFGFRTNGINPEGLTYAEGGRNGQGWFKLDNFRLTYDSEAVSADINETIVDATVVARQYFTVDGAQIAAPQQGVNIVKEILSNGQVKVSKLLK